MTCDFSPSEKNNILLLFVFVRFISNSDQVNILRMSNFCSSIFLFVHSINIIYDELKYSFSWRQGCYSIIFFAFCIMYWRLEKKSKLFHEFISNFCIIEFSVTLQVPQQPSNSSSKTKSFVKNKKEFRIFHTSFFRKECLKLNGSEMLNGLAKDVLFISRLSWHKTN